MYPVKVTVSIRLLLPAFYLLVSKRRKVNTAFHGAVHFHSSKRDFPAAGLFINEIFAEEFKYCRTLQKFSSVHISLFAPIIGENQILRKLNTSL